MLHLLNFYQSLDSVWTKIPVYSTFNELPARAASTLKVTLTRRLYEVTTPPSWQINTTDKPKPPLHMYDLITGNHVNKVHFSGKISILDRIDKSY